MPLQAITPDNPLPLPDARVLVRVETVFGVPRLYPVCDRGQIFMQLTRDKTLAPSILPLIRALGYELIAVDANKNPLGRWID